jgi:hypothetical protein
MSSSVCTSTQENCNDGKQQAWVTSTASAVVFIGAIVGQLSVKNFNSFLNLMSFSFYLL